MVHSTSRRAYHAPARFFSASGAVVTSSARASRTIARWPGGRLNSNQRELRPVVRLRVCRGERRFPRIGTPYGAPAITEVTTRASTTMVAVSVVAPTKACATHRFTMVFPSTKRLNAFSMGRLRRIQCVDRSAIYNPSRQGRAAGLFRWLLGFDLPTRRFPKTDCCGGRRNRIGRLGGQ